MSEQTTPLTADQMILLSDKDNLFQLFDNFVTTINEEKNRSFVSSLNKITETRDKLIVTDSDKMKIVKKIRKDSAYWVEQDKKTHKKEFVAKWTWLQNWIEKIKESDK